TPEFHYFTHGIYDVTLQATDEDGNSATVTKTIDVLCVFGGGTGGTDHDD
ncbi:MAG: hypothetical protein HRT68_13560, partial [Flavobacteriaceae bacterium]|nr:hypothetical protein [Flavobacteriaceae bacterium]